MTPVKIFLYFFSGIAALAASYLLLFRSTEDEVVNLSEKVQVVTVPEVDRMKEMFNLAPPRLPIVETVTYSSRVPWQKGKSAWLSDYANHFKTSRHFIARSLHQKPDYFKQTVKEGDRFNVFKSDANFSFYFILDLSTLKLLFYYVDLDTHQAELIKTYTVSAGRKDLESPSGSLTPLGIYTLGDKVAIYDTKKVGFYQGEKTELVKIFGTRWIPFDKEVKDCTASAKGLGLHGMPWVEDPFTKDFREDNTSIGQLSSDGCIRLKTEDIEEIYSIIISRPTTIEIVKNYETSSVYVNQGKVLVPDMSMMAAHGSIQGD
jgi:hypothetical protein